MTIALSYIPKIARPNVAMTMINDFDSIFYFGDGLWDYKTTIELDIDFIGVDYHKNGKLINKGAKRVIQNYTDQEKILNWIKN